MSVQRGIHKGDGGPASPPYGSGPLEIDTAMVFNEPTVDSYKRYVLEENFNQLPQANGSTAYSVNVNFEILGTGASDDDITFATDHGALDMETDASGSQQVILLPHLTSGLSAWTGVKWGTENQVIWECVIRTGSSVAGIILWAGLKLTNDQDITADDDQAFFRFDTGETVWETVHSVGGVADTEFSTDVTVAIDTNYYLKIAIDSDRKPHFFIDNKEVYVGAALTDDVNLIPYIGVEGNAKTLYVVKEKISRIIFE